MVIIRGTNVFPSVAASGQGLFFFCVMGKLKTFYRSSTLVGDVANNVRDSVSLIAKMPICDINHTDVAKAFASIAGIGVKEVALHLRSDMLAVEILEHAVHTTCETVGSARFLSEVGISAGCEAASNFRVLTASDRFVVVIVGSIPYTGPDIPGNFWCLIECADNVLHMMCLTTDEASEMYNNPLGLITLALDGLPGVL